MLAGAVSLAVSPIEQYPDMAPPQIQVTARYPGATAEVIANTVAAPLEAPDQRRRQPALLPVGEFVPGQPDDQHLLRREATRHPTRSTQNRVSQALPQLPQVVTQGVTVDSKSSSFLLVISIFSKDDSYDATFLDNFANLGILEELKRVPGANRASVFGLPDIAMRVWLRPDRMAQLG